MSCSLAAALAVPVHAQTVPDSGQLLRQLPAQRQGNTPAPSRITVRPEPSRSAPPQGPTLVLKQLTLDADVPGVDLAALDRAAAPSVGTALDLQGLYALADRLGRLVREQGFPLAQVLVPAQDVDDGHVRLLVRVGRLDRQSAGAGLRVDNRAPRLKTHVVQETVAQALQAPGDALRLADLETGLRHINAMPGVAATASLERGSQPGTTQVVVQVDEGPLWAASVTADNAGNRYTGSERVTAVLSLLDPSGRGDGATLQATAAERSSALSSQYSMPLGATGWRGAVAASTMRYRLGGSLAALDASGWAYSLGASVQTTLLRSQQGELGLQLGLDRRRLGDDSLGQPVARKLSTVLTATLSGSRGDDWQGGGLMQATLAVASGSLNLDAVAAHAALDAAGPRASGGFLKVNSGLARLQQLGAATALFAGVRGQWASGNLDSSEKLQFGGAGAVRAYPSGEGSVDSGTLWTAELRQDVRGGPAVGVLQALLFVDAAEGAQHQNPWSGWDASAPGQSNRVRLAGAGVGLSALRGPLSLRAAYAWRLGHNPQAGAGGADADGRHRPGRLWLQAAYEI